MSIKDRKLDHINISLKKNVEFKNKKTGLGDINFRGVELAYKTLPEIDKEKIICKTKFLGKDFSAPLMVAGITGGVEKAKKINRDIAKACEEVGIGMGLGSQRAMLEKPELSSTYEVRKYAPNIFLAGNIGVTQASSYSLLEIEHALETIEADALAVHVNAAHEAIQPEGTTNFSKGIKTISQLAKNLSYPIIVKEVGSGVSYEVAAELAKTSIKAIDVGGAGGTSWTGIEYLRTKKKKHTYWDYGIPTAVSILEVKKAFGGKIIATGGIRSGLDVVKACVLGADLCGVALPVLKAQHKGGARGVEKYLENLIDEIKTGMFLLGAKKFSDLKKKKYVLLGKTKEWVEQRKLK